MKVKNFFVALWRSVKSIIRGELLINMRVDKWLPQIFVLFVLGVTTIFIKLKIDETMVQLEKSSAELETIRIRHAQKTCELVGLEKLSTIESLLEAQGLELGLPDKPADRIKK